MAEMSDLKIDDNFKVTVNNEEVQYVACCDCGLVHEIYFDIYNNSIDVVYTRDEARTKAERIKRAGGKSKLYIKELQEARARENLHPPEAPDAVKTEASSIGAILGKGEKWRPQLQK